MSEEQVVYIVDDDPDVRESLVILMETVGQAFVQRKDGSRLARRLEGQQHS